MLVGRRPRRALARASPARRDAVFVVLLGADARPACSRSRWRVGAESVAELPRSEGWLVERLTDVVDTGPARGLTVGVVGGSGGSGATTFACALGQIAGRAGSVGGRRPRPARARCRPRARARPRRRASGGTRSATPPAGSAPVRCASRCPGATASPPSAGTPGRMPRRCRPSPSREALSAARRGHDTVVVDLPRVPRSADEEIVARCDHGRGHGRHRLSPGSPRRCGCAVASPTPARCGWSSAGRGSTTTRSAG